MSQAEYLRQRHQELEVQIRQVKEERDALTTELENLHERLLLLEKQRQLQDEQVGTVIMTTTTMVMMMMMMVMMMFTSVLCFLENSCKMNRWAL